MHCAGDDGHYTECGSCGGLWLEEEHFERIVETKDASAIGKYTASTSEGKTATALSQRDEVRYLPCPVCNNLMNRKNFAKASGVIIDWCKGHGFWFDAHELERILLFVQQGGMDSAREREIAQAKYEMGRARKTSAAPVITQHSAGDLLDLGRGPSKTFGGSVLRALATFVDGLFESRY